MKKVLFPILALVLVVGLALPMAVPALATISGNLLDNPGAEDGDMTGWTSSSGVAAKTTQPESTGYVEEYAGDYFFSLHDSSSPASMSQTVDLTSLPGTPVSFTASGYVQTELWWSGSPSPVPGDYDEGKLIVEFFNITPTSLGQFTLAPVEHPVLGSSMGGKDYTQFSLNDSVPSGAVSAVYTLEGYLKQGSRVNIFYDDLNFEVSVASIEITKRANRTRAHEGDTIIYTYTVTNTGDVPLSNVGVTDPSVHRGPAYVSGDTNIDDKLDTTETWIYRAAYYVPYFFVGPVTNTGTAAGWYEGTRVSDSSDEVVVHIVHNPGIDVEKATNEVAYFNGTEVTYHYYVENTGDCSLDVTLTDSELGEITDPSGETVEENGYLDPGETWHYTADYTLECPEDNYEYSLYSNVATAIGVDAIGGEVTDCDCWTLIIFQWQPRTIGYWGNWDNHYDWDEDEDNDFDALVEYAFNHSDNLEGLATHMGWGDPAEIEGSEIHDFLLGKPPKLKGTHKAMFLMEKQFMATAFNVFSYMDWVDPGYITGFTGTADVGMDPNATVYLSGNAATLFGAETTVLEILHQIADEKLGWFNADDVQSIKTAQEVLDMMNNAEKNNYELFVDPDFDHDVCLLTGHWLLSVNGGAYEHDMTITSQDMGGNLSGNGGYPAGGSYSKTWVLVNSSITDSSVTLTLDYNSSTYEATDIGTVSDCGDSMGGTWTDNGGGSGTWTATRT